MIKTPLATILQATLWRRRICCRIIQRKTRKSCTSDIVPRNGFGRTWMRPQYVTFHNATIIISSVGLVTKLPFYSVWWYGGWWLTNGKETGETGRDTIEGLFQHSPRWTEETRGNPLQLRWSVSRPKLESSISQTILLYRIPCQRRSIYIKKREWLAGSGKATAGYIRHIQPTYRVHPGCWSVYPACL
jgi:hypothetical protein